MPSRPHRYVPSLAAGEQGQERINGLCLAGGWFRCRIKRRNEIWGYRMDKRKRRRATVLGLVGILFIVLLVSVVNYDMHGGDRNSAFFIITSFLSTMSGCAFIVTLFDPWREDTVK